MTYWVIIGVGRLIGISFLSCVANCPRFTYLLYALVHVSPEVNIYLCISCLLALKEKKKVLAHLFPKQLERNIRVQ